MKLSSAWTKRQEDDGGWIHTLSIAGTDAFMKVEKSRGGDYTVTALREGDPAGGEVDYYSTLQTAKAEAERIVTANEWRDYLID